MSHAAREKNHRAARSIKSISSIIIDAPISCLSFAPKYSTIVLLGTYQLHESQDQATYTIPQQSRTGSLQVFDLTDDRLSVHSHCISGQELP